MKLILKFKLPGLKALTGIFTILIALPAASQTVTTIAGGRITPYGPDYGFVDGDSLQESQFNFPTAIAIGFDARLYVADKNNNAIRRLDLSANSTITVIQNLNAPVGIIFDNDGTMYTLTSGDGFIHKFDTNYNHLGTVNLTAFSSPTAFTIDSSKNFYVAESGGNLLRVHSSNGVPVVVASGFNNPQGVVMLDNGMIAVSDTGNHSIKVVNPTTSSVTNFVGISAGFSNGVPSVVKFNTPTTIAKAPNGALVVADRYNHRVRLVQTNGYTTTIYGIDKSLWEDCPTCTPSVFEGWSDGTVNQTPLDPAAREPMGIAISADGMKIYTTEVYYHIIRVVSGINLSVQGGTNGPAIPAPTISPDSGYYPDGITITVSSSLPDVYYTTDGSEPTTNSLKVQIIGNTGTINWMENGKDISLLRIKAFSGTNSSITVSGSPPTTSIIGIPRDRQAGPGSTILVPVVASMRPGEQIKSVQFIAQITPNGAAPVISDQFRLLDVTTNDYIQVAVPALEPSKPVALSSSSLLINNSRSLIITAIGTNSNFEVSSYSVVAMLVVPVPATANIGDSYTIQITTASGTSDGLSSSPTNSVILTPLPQRLICITNVAYTVGDTASAGWYEAGAFGDGKLLNNDVLNAFYASLGIKTPPSFTDIFDAMDAFPDDEPGMLGGDGDIRYLDWQRILFRSLGLLTNTPAGTNWARYWTTGGVKTNNVAGVQIANSPIIQNSQTASIVWEKDARIGALTVANVQPSATVNVPIYCKTADGIVLNGLQFRAIVIPIGDAPPIEQSPDFVKAITANPYIAKIGNNQLACVWGGYGFGDATDISGSNLLGYVRFVIPTTAKSGDCYTVRFARPDSGSGNRQFNLESFPANVWVLSDPKSPDAMVSDEWRTNFFGSITNRWANDNEDPDGDGVPNWQEFIRGTNPTKLYVLIRKGMLQNNGKHSLRWFGKSGLRYTVEWSDNLNNWNEIENLSGSGDVLEFNLTDEPGLFRFFRVKTK